MSSRTPWLSAWFPALLVAPLVAQRAAPVDRQLVAAGVWAEARYNYAYWDAARANWDSAFAATVTYAGERPPPTDVQYFHRPSRWARAVAQMLEGERGTALHLLLRLPGGAERGVSVTRSTALDGRSPLDRPALDADTLPDGVIWVRVNSFADPDVLTKFDRALGDAAREGVRHRGLILDLRETTWTAIGREQAHALLARLVERPFLTLRRRIPLYRADSLSGWGNMPSDTIWPPVRRERLAYTGPVVVLSSTRTAGAAEDFLVAFQAGGRGPLLGGTSARPTGETARLTPARPRKPRT